MRVLHVVKTSDGARWAAHQVEELIKKGIDAHVVLPSLQNGKMLPEWRATKATLHEKEMDFPAQSLWKLPQLLKDVRQLIEQIQPHLIHSHFVGTTVVLRYALAKKSTIPRIFQIPGPLHLEHWFYRKWEVSCADEYDYWIASSQYTRQRYLRYGISPQRLFLSYYGNRHSYFCVDKDSSSLRKKFSIPEQHKIVGNINYIYPPKLYLGQMMGLKGHSDVIRALSLVKAADITAILFGSTFGRSNWYEKMIRRQASKANNCNIIMPGFLTSQEVLATWREFDLAIHVPLSENCGGVVEPLLAGVPTIAANVGGLPEVVIDGVTGILVPGRDPRRLAEAIDTVLSDFDRHKNLAEKGRMLVEKMFDVERTAAEIWHIYQHLCYNSPRPAEFDSHRVVAEL